MADLDSDTQTAEKGGERKPFRMTPETAKRIRRDIREWKWRERIRKWEVSSRFYWAIDPTPDDYPYIFADNATTRARLRRAHIRSWFSWPNLGRLAEKEIFGVGLGAVMLVPAAGGLLDIVERSIMKLLQISLELGLPLQEISPGLGLPLQAEVLFFSGLCFVIGNALYFFRCPAIVKLAISRTDNAPKPPMFNRIVVGEAAFLLSQYVDVTFITAEKLRMPDRVTKLKTYEREMCEYCLKRGDAPPRVGFAGYGMYLAEKFLLASAASRGGRLFVRWDLKSPWKAVEEPSVMLANEFTIYNGLLHYPQHTMREMEGATEKDIFLEWFLADAGSIPQLEKGGHVRYIDSVLRDFDPKYFDGCDFDRMANVLAEWQYYLRPVSRVLVALSFVFAVGLLGVFLFLQTANVLQML